MHLSPLCCFHETPQMFHHLRRLSDNGCLILNSLQSLVRNHTHSDVQMVTEWIIVCYAAQ